MKSALAAGLACVLLAGCYSYQPLGSVDAAMPPTGTAVQVRLTTSGATSLASQVGPDILYLQGQIVSADPDALTLAVTRAETARRIEIEWKGEQVTLPRSEIASVEQKRLSVGHTVLIGGLAGGSVVAAYALFGTSGSSSGAVAPPVIGHQ
jgi:hypothetical protein